ncbi:hypothetical protein ACM16X_02700 [Haloarcula japonica]|uniref:hypothetical protein n=1 Tax=Haloarcula japonica TaxID=29282 RepID=UPI0039F67363
MDADDALRKIERQYNFKPGRKYPLYKVTDKRGRNGGTVLSKEKVQPRREIQLERNPPSGYTSIYDLKDKKDFFQYFENRFPDLPDGRYTAITSRGGNKGFAWFFLLEYRNGRVTDWTKKSKATNPREGYRSSYYALPKYFRLREEMNV